MASLGYMRPSMVAQNFPSAPVFTEKNIPDLSGKIYFITGANAGVGFELTRILYAANACVYMACRSEDKARQAIASIEKSATGGDKPAENRDSRRGRLEYVHLDLSDLRTIKPAVEAFLAEEKQLHVLFNNAGIMNPPPNKKTAQGYDMELGTNCLGHFLLTQLLTPVLEATAAHEPIGSVRVVWVASMAAELYSGKNGIDMSNIRGKEYVREPDVMQKYGNSKAGAYLHSVEYARRHKSADGHPLISVAVNPGNLDSGLYRNTKEQTGFLKLSMQMFTRFMLHPPVYGAYTQLFAGFSPDVTPEKTGSWIGPWGRFFSIRSDIAKNAKPKSEGGLGGAELFWNWSMDQVKPFM